MKHSSATYRARAKAKAKLEKAERWLSYLADQTALAMQAKADAEAELRALGGVPAIADPDLTKLLDDL
jgi:hypothetical protein